MVIHSGIYRGVVHGKLIELEQPPDLPDGQAVVVDVSLPRAEASEFEEQYQRIGWWKGPLGGYQVQQEVRAFWVGAGRQGAQWLGQRLRSETHPELLDGAAAVLADIGTPGIPVILAELELGAGREPTRALLKALGWMSRQRQPPVVAGLVSLVQGYLSHEDPDVREAAVHATAILPDADAARLLTAALRAEHDAGVREILQDEISERDFDRGI
jgi:hypothetical protein